MSSITINNKDLSLENIHLDSVLRPQTLIEYVGQESIKKVLNIVLSAALERNTPPEHILLYGPPGLGKTTLANIIAKELKTNLRTTSGPALTKVGDLAAILTNLSPNDVLFIDEIHRINKSIEEVLYPAMESGKLDIIIGKGPGARTVSLDLPPFTLVGATTRIGMLTAPLRSRFHGGTFRLQFYTKDELITIILANANKLAIKISLESAQLIAERSRFTPRISNYLLKRVRDVSQLERSDIDIDLAIRAIQMLDIDNLGLGQSERDYLKVLIDKFSGGPTGISTLSSALSEDEGTLEDVIEPYLIQLGLIDKTLRGRVATPLAYKHIEMQTSIKNIINK